MFSWLLIYRGLSWPAALAGDPGYGTSNIAIRAIRSIETSYLVWAAPQQNNTGGVPDGSTKVAAPMMIPRHVWG